MKSGWVEGEAQAAVEHYARQGVGRDLALRVYSTRLLGREPRLVLHGGGNTSVKTALPDLLGEEVQVLCVKGSGADMASIEPAGLPAVRLERLRKLRKQLADQSGVPPYVIFHDYTLREMARQAPTSVAEFAAIPGVGQAKLARYGQMFTDEIRAGLEND